MSVTTQTSGSTSVFVDAHRAGEETVMQTKAALAGLRRPTMPTAERKRLDRATVTQAPIVGLIRGIGAALIVAAMVIVVLAMVFSLDIVQNVDGPFGNLTTDFQTYGVAALSLVGIGIIVLGARFAMDMFGNGGMGGR